MQPNIWKYFPFPKIFSPKNIYTWKIFYIQPNAALLKKDLS